MKKAASFFLSIILFTTFLPTPATAEGKTLEQVLMTYNWLLGYKNIVPYHDLRQSPYRDYDSYMIGGTTFLIDPKSEATTVISADCGASVDRIIQSDYFYTKQLILIASLECSFTDRILTSSSIDSWFDQAALLLESVLEEGYYESDHYIYYVLSDFLYIDEKSYYPIYQ